MDNKQLNFQVMEMTRMNIPVATEYIKTRQDYIPYTITEEDDFFDIITESYQNSTTHSACVEGISDMIYGKGVFSKNESLKNIIDTIIPQEEIKRLAFDIKLYGIGSLQVYWNDLHTKVIKVYHVPVQNLRAEKLKDLPKVQNYFYCTDWNDYKKVKNRKIIPAFGTSSEKMEILYIKNYTPGKYYYSLPDWYASLQLSYVEAELSNLHYNNVANGFFPSTLIQFNNGIPSPEEREANEVGIMRKFGSTKNAGRTMFLYNNSKEDAATIETIDIPDLALKFEYVANYVQDKILVSHRVTSPLLFGVRTASNGFSSTSDELKTAYSIMLTMTINPFQNLIINNLNEMFKKGGYPGAELQFEQLTPLVLLTDQAESSDTSIQQAQNDVDNTSNTTT